MTRCVTLLSGGLDSMLAIRIMQAQGIEVEALNFKTMFTCCQDLSAQAAHRLGVRLTVVSQEDDYLELIKNPRFGYGKGANPCVDCRIYMFERAQKFMEQIGADFIVSGEVVGQRPMSQKRRDLDVISHQSGLEDLLLRPLSAKLLLPTLPERKGLVDRERLYAFQGRSRKGLIRLAKAYGLDEVPTPSTGCALTEPLFGKKVHDLIQIQVDPQPWDFQLVKVGRHFRFDDQTKVIVGRDQTENQQLEYSHRLPEATSTALFDPESFSGPVALLSGPPTDEAIEFALGLVLRYGTKTSETDNTVSVSIGEETTMMLATAHPEATAAETISGGR
jgi:tRNA U34 2-thiouridine synthase MnmA/TrmU